MLSQLLVMEVRNGSCQGHVCIFLTKSRLAFGARLLEKRPRLVASNVQTYLRIEKNFGAMSPLIFELKLELLGGRRVCMISGFFGRRANDGVLNPREASVDGAVRSFRSRHVFGEYSN